MKNEQSELLGVFKKFPFLSLYLATTNGDFGVGNLTAVSIAIAATHSEKWETTYSNLMALHVMGQWACEEYDRAMKEYLMASFKQKEHTATPIWFSGDGDGDVDVDIASPIPSIVAIFGEQDEKQFMLGLATLQMKRFISVEDSVIVPGQRFFDTFINGCRANGYM